MNRSVIFWFLSVLAYAAYQVVSFSTVGAEIASALTQPAGTPDAMSPEEIKVAVQIGLGVTVAVAVVLTALWLLFILKMRAGRNWARIGLTLVGGLYALFTFLQVKTMVTEALGATTLTLGIASALLVVVAIPFMWPRSASPFFRR